MRKRVLRRPLRGADMRRAASTNMFNGESCCPKNATFAAWNVRSRPQNPALHKTECIDRRELGIGAFLETGRKKSLACHWDLSSSTFSIVCDFQLVFARENTRSSLFVAGRTARNFSATELALSVKLPTGLRRRYKSKTHEVLRQTNFQQATSCVITKNEQL